MIDTPAVVDDPQGKAPDPVAYRKYLEQTQPDKLPAYDEYLKATGQNAGPDQYVQSLHQALKGASEPDAMVQGLHTAYKSGALGRTIKNANEKEAADLPDNPAITAGLEALATPLTGVPGGALAESGARKLLTRESKTPLADIQSDVNRASSDVPYASALGRGIGAIATQGVLPASGLKAGAIMMGADQLLNNDPNSPLLGTGRLVRGVLGAGVGGLAGGLAERAITGGRALLAGNPATTRAAMLADQAASAKDLYTKALSEGQGHAAPQAVRDWLSSPDIAPIVEDLKSTRVFADTPVESPEMVDAVYKNLSDKAGVIKSKLSAVVPRNANLGRVAGADNALARQEGLDAVASTGPKGEDNPFMPTYPKAVQDFANHSRGIQAFDRGYDALKGSDVAAKNLNRPEKTAEGLTDWLSGLKANAADAENATKGILGRFNRLGQPALKLNPLRGFGLPAADAQLAALRTADQAAGNNLPSALQRAILALSQSQTAP